MAEKRRLKHNEHNMSADDFLKAVRESVGRQYSDGELLALLVSEAKRDCFQGVGRVFLADFCEQYRCPVERVMFLLRSSGLKWRFDPASRILFICF